MQTEPRARPAWPYDAIFLITAALFAWLATWGSLELSAAGAVMDSDLETYAQGMAGEAMRPLFAADPVLAAANPANSIPNLQRCLASLAASQSQWADGLILAGGLAIFLFLAGWYLLGRKILGTPVLAALLALCTSITIWVGWGTFWGIFHSNPVPRVFFAALFPFLLLAFFYSLPGARLRAPTMLATGLCIWIHGVSALNCGAMFLLAFALIKPGTTTHARHTINTALCLAAFLLPVLVFLWPSLVQSRPFTPGELEIFQKLFNLRWQEDYAGFGKRLLQFLSPASPVLPVISAGLCSWLILFRKKKFTPLLKATPCFLCALLIVSLVCWLEGIVAPKIGRLQMGHELVRGLRLLIPISWLLIVAAVSLVTTQLMQRLLLGLVLILNLLVSRDQQYIAAQYAISRYTGLTLPLTSLAHEQAANANTLRSVFETLRKVIPAGETVFCPEDAMPVRYLGQRPLAHTFKDGYVFFYNKDSISSRRWLNLENLIHSSPDGWKDAWLASGAPWLLLPPDYHAGQLRNGRLVLAVHGWKIIHRL